MSYGCEVCGRTRCRWWRAPFDEDGMPRSRPPLCNRCAMAWPPKVWMAVALRDAAQDAGLSGPFAFLAPRPEPE